MIPYLILLHFSFFSKVHSCMDNKNECRQLERTSQTSLIHNKIGNTRFFLNRKRMLFFFLASDLKGPKHDLRFLISLYIKWIICVF